MLTIIVALFLLGIVLISFELIVPGGLLGLLGGIAVFASWILAFMEFGTEGGFIAVIVGVVVLVLCLVIELKLLARTKFGRRFFLDWSIDAVSQKPLATPELVGQKGEALTTLAPTGVVMVQGQRYEAFSMSGLVEKGTRLEVVDFDNFRVRVKKI